MAPSKKSEVEFISIEKTLKDAEPSATNHLVHRIVEQTVCPICQDHMFVPFMTHCGHNFCYECVSSWLQENESCPACRATVSQAPSLNIALQSLALTLFTTTITVIGHTPPELEKERQRKIQLYKKDLMKQRLFNGIFKDMATAIVDEDDGVQRCSVCQWEIEGDMCQNCHTRVRGVNTDLYNYDDDESLNSDVDDLEYARSFVNGDVRVPYDSGSDEEEDSDDWIVDDAPLDQISIDSEDDGLSSGDSSPVRAPRNYRPSQVEEPWEDSNEDDLGSDAAVTRGTATTPMSDAPSWHGFDRNSQDDSEDSDEALRDEYVRTVMSRSNDDDDDDDTPMLRHSSRSTAIIVSSDDDSDEY